MSAPTEFLPCLVSFHKFCFPNPSHIWYSTLFGLTKKNNKTGTTRNNSLNKCAQYSTCAFACNEKLCRSGEKKNKSCRHIRAGVGAGIVFKLG